MFSRSLVGPLLTAGAAGVVGLFEILSIATVDYSTLAGGRRAANIHLDD